MAGIYVYSDRSDLAAELISFAKGTGKTTIAITFHEKEAQVIKNNGADKLYVLNGESSMPENYGKALAEMLKKEGAELFVVGATARGRDLAARVAGYLDCAMVSDAAGLSIAEAGLITDKMMYGGAVVQSETLVGLSVVTVPVGKFEALQGEGDSEIVTIDVKPDPRVTLVETAPISNEGVDLSVAEKVVCVGMGLDKAEDLQMAKELAQVIGAEVGCTRGVAEERHWLPVSNYIGISGAVIKPALYLAMGVSGQIQHVFGMRDSKIIVAVDTNEKSPIFKAADYGIVGDMYEVIPLLTAALRKA